MPELEYENIINLHSDNHTASLTINELTPEYIDCIFSYTHGEDSDLTVFNYNHILPEAEFYSRMSKVDGYFRYDNYRKQIILDKSSTLSRVITIYFDEVNYKMVVNRIEITYMADPTESFYPNGG